MITAVAGPLAIAVGGLVGSRFIARRLRPHLAARFLLGVLILSAVSVLWALLIVTLSGTPALHGIAELLAWCDSSFREHSELPTPAGLFGLGLLIGAAVASVRARRIQLRVCAPEGSSGIAVVANDEPDAFALPGTPGQIVITTGMLDLLDPEERLVLVTHEQAHLDLHHHRYVRTAEIAGAAVPVLRPLVRHLRLATERWADEVTATKLRDRGLVAAAVARAALGSGPLRPGVLGMSDTGVVERVEALLRTPPQPRRSAEIVAGAVLAVSTFAFAASTIEAHHWLARVLALCWS